MLKIRINTNALKKITHQQVKPIVNKVAYEKIKKAALEAQSKMIANFENHLVTKEIESGPDGYNMSGTLSGYGNLYSFIGFEEGMDPITPIRRILQKSLEIKSLPSGTRSMITNFLVELPSKQEIIEASPMPWAEGRSWVEGIEKGISGLGQYLNKVSFSSRSGEGVQSENKIRGGGFKNSKYLSDILNQLNRDIRKYIK